MDTEGDHHHNSSGKDLDVEEKRSEVERKAKVSHAVQQRSFLCAMLCCIPLGVAAFIYSIKARDSLIRGDKHEYGKLVKRSNSLLKLAYQIGLLVNIFFLGGILTAIILLLVLLTGKTI